MVDVTQTQACIQCGACVSNCMSMEVDPLFVGPAALAKAYRFVGDPRDGATRERLEDLAEDPHGMYDCTHCFQCVDACPKGVEPMNQIMRLRRIANGDHRIVDPNNGHRHEAGFVENVRRNGILNEADLMARLLRRQASPAHLPMLVDSLPGIVTGVTRAQDRRCGRSGTRTAADFRELQRYFDAIEARPKRVELNLYVSGYEDDPGSVPAARPARTRRRRSGPNPRKLRADTESRDEGRLLARLREPRLHPELQHSMARIAPLLGLTLVELDRASCCGAGVIAEHNQELADTLNARTFALAQRAANGAELMMNICSTCQGAHSECQERLDANTAYRDHVNETLAADGLRYERGIVNKNLLWLLVEDIGLDALRGLVSARSAA